WVVAWVAVVHAAAVAATPPPSTQAFSNWAATPPMGWNSWDCYGPAATEEAVLANADYMAKNLKSHGYDTIVIDGRWCRPDPGTGMKKTGGMDLMMDENGRLRPAAARFPSSRETRSFKPIADAVHAKGLKFGFHILRGIPRQAVNKNVPIAGTEA